MAAPYKAPGVHGLVLNELKSPAARGGHLHLIFEAHVVLDHLPGHAGDLIDIVGLVTSNQFGARSGSSHIARRFLVQVCKRWNSRRTNLMVSALGSYTVEAVGLVSKLRIAHARWATQCLKPDALAAVRVRD